MISKIILALLIISSTSSSLISQVDSREERNTDREKTSKKILQWTFIQLIPSPVLFNDAGSNSNSLKFGLRWQVTPLNISFSTNKYVSPVQFLFVNPMRRYTGSLEFFVQPELAVTTFQNSGLNQFGLGTGARVNIPVKNFGEHLYVSLGGKYNFRGNDRNSEKGYYGIEAGAYAIFGVLGVQFNYNFSESSKYNIGLYIKYW